MPGASADTAEEFTIEDDSEGDCTLSDEDMTDEEGEDTSDSAGPVSFVTTCGKPIVVTRLTSSPVRNVSKPIASDYFPVKDNNGNVYRAYMQEHGNSAVVIDTVETDAAVVTGLSTQINYTTQLAKASLTYNSNLLKGVTNGPQVSKLWKTVFGAGMLLSTVHANSVVIMRTEESKKRRREKTRQKRKAADAPAPTAKRATGASPAVHIKQEPSAEPTVQSTVQVSFTLKAADVVTVAQFVASL